MTFINTIPISGVAIDNPELIANDGLHPSGKMYEQWVSKILSKLQ